MPYSSSPRVQTHVDAGAAARALAAHIAQVLVRKPRLVIGLPTGRTPIALYRELSALAAAGRLDLSGITTFNLDEFLGIPDSHPGSYRRFMHQHLFDAAGLRADQINFLRGDAVDPDVECVRYERAIADAGGIDLQILGIGGNGHIGFNEPARQLSARTHRVALTRETRRSNAALFGGDEETVPREALSMGMATILQARSIVLLANGGAKASCVERVVNGDITTELPASFLQLHPDVDLVLDAAAAATLVSGAAPVG